MAARGNTGRGRRRSRDGSGGIDEERGVFMISVAAELADMHPQTLRMYEARGLITPKRSAKQTRLYSQNDVERLQRIQRMTSEEGLNLAGVEAILQMENQVARMRSELERLRRRATELELQMNEEVERALAEADRAVGGTLTRALQASGDPFTVDFSAALSDLR